MTKKSPYVVPTKPPGNDHNYIEYQMCRSYRHFEPIHYVPAYFYGSTRIIPLLKMNNQIHSFPMTLESNEKPMVFEPNQFTVNVDYADLIKTKSTYRSNMIQHINQTQELKSLHFTSGDEVIETSRGITVLLVFLPSIHQGGEVSIKGERFQFSQNPKGMLNVGYISLANGEKLTISSVTSGKMVYLKYLMTYKTTVKEIIPKPLDTVPLFRNIQECLTVGTSVAVLCTETNPREFPSYGPDLQMYLLLQSLYQSNYSVDLITVYVKVIEYEGVFYIKVHNWYTKEQIADICLDPGTYRPWSVGKTAFVNFGTKVPLGCGNDFKKLNLIPDENGVGFDIEYLSSAIIVQAQMKNPFIFKKSDDVVFHFM